ncbi:MAG TPA: hypothetical protein VFV91_01030 [Gaiellaceae bacterium]|nr:hypothetical protein [Gaiellaceae bacterium]
MRGALIVTRQILVAATGLAVISGLIGLIVVHFAGWGGALKGFGWGMVIGGAAVGFLAGGSGIPTENLARGRIGAFGTYWGQSAAQPQSPLQLVLGSLLAFGGGVGLLLLSYR